MKPRTQFLVPVWGQSYIRRFMELVLPSFLAPGNLPALAEATQLEVVILTSAANISEIENEPALTALKAIAPVSFIAIDDLIVGTLYGVTLTLAYLRAITETGEDMVNRFFVFMNADLVLADGSLRGVAKHIVAGRIAILACSIRAISEDLEDHLRRMVDQARHVLVIPPRQLVAMAMRSLHPTQIAKIVNNDFCHSIHVNQFYWQVDAMTLVSRHYLMFMLCLKPERVVTEVHAFCDYSFVPEFCPSGGAVAMEDSDDFFFLEMQSRTSERDFLGIGRQSIEKIASGLSRWTTREHRENAKKYTLVFHGGDLPKETETICREADRYIKELNVRLTPDPQPYRHHPYWTGTLAVWKRQKALLCDSVSPKSSDSSSAIAPPLPQRFSKVVYRALLQRFPKAVYKAIFGFPPRVRMWHPDWLDYRYMRVAIQRHLCRADSRILYIKENVGLFELFVGATQVATMEQVLKGHLAELACGNKAWTLVIVEPRRGQFIHIRAVTDILSGYVAKGGQVLVFCKDTDRGASSVDLADVLLEQLAWIAPRELHKTNVVFGGGGWKRTIRSMFDWGAEKLAGGKLYALPLVSVTMVAVLVLAWMNNVKQRSAQDRKKAVWPCSSVTMIIDY